MHPNYVAKKSVVPALNFWLIVLSVLIVPLIIQIFKILNAKSFEAQGFSMVIDDDDLSPELLTEKVTELYFNRQTYLDAMGKSNQLGAVATIIKLIEECTAK